MANEVFVLLGWAWDVDLAYVLSLRHPVRPVLTRTVAGVRGWIRVDAERAASANLSRPLLIVPLPGAPEPDNHLVIDGWHRIHRALSEGVEELPALFLTAEDEVACRLYGHI